MADRQGDAPAEPKGPRQPVLDEAMLDAALEYIQGCAVPILTPVGSNFVVQGTGTFFKVGAHRFLITAAHVGTDEKEKPRWRNLGTCSRDRSRFFKLEGYVVYTTKDNRDPDVAVMRLEDRLAEEIERESGWTFLTTAEVCAPKVRGNHDHIFVCGYPSELFKPAPSFEKLRPLVLCTEFYEGPTDHLPFDYVPWFHLLLDNFPEGWNDADQRVKLPCLKGISGCAVWTIGMSDAEIARAGGVWRPDDIFKLIGVEVGVFTKIIRATGWGVAAQLMAGKYPELREVFEKVYEMPG